MNLNLRKRYCEWIRRRVQSNPLRYRHLHADLVSARSGVTTEHYLASSVICALLGGLILGVAAFLLSDIVTVPLLSIRIYDISGLTSLEEGVPGVSEAVIRAAALVVGVCAGTYLTYTACLKYPGTRKNMRRTDINVSLHNAISYMYAMHRGGAEMMDIFRSISENSAIYGETAYEYRQIVRDADYFGYDVMSAIRHLEETTPSDKLRDFLKDLLSIIDSGGNLSEFLASRVRMYQDEAQFEQERFLSTLQLVAESYVTLFVAGPLFLIIVMIVMGLIGGSATIHLSLLAYVLIPVGSMIFIIFSDLISIGDQGVKRYTRAVRLYEFSDARVTPEVQAEEETFFRQLEKYDRYQRLRTFLRHPVDHLTQHVGTTLYITIPLAAIYVIYTFLTVPAYQDIELYIDIIDDHLIFATLLVHIPFGVFNEIRKRKIAGIEASIPEFLHRMSNINEVGLTLSKAIAIMAKSTIGVMSYEIRRMKRDIDWGGNINDVLIRFEERVRTPLIARTVTLITKASAMSGNISEILSIAASDAKMSDLLRRARASEMFVYTAIIYVSFLVFIFVVIVINTQFLSLIETGGVAEGIAAMGVGTATPVDTTRRILYHACLIQAFFSGLVAGQMGEASLIAGVKHAVVMIIIAVVAFALLV